MRKFLNRIHNSDSSVSVDSVSGKEVGGKCARAAVVLEDGFRDAKSGVLEVILAKDAAGRCYSSG